MKILLIIALILAVLGVCALGTSAYFAAAYYWSGDTQKAPVSGGLLDDKIDSDGDGLTDKQEKDIYRTDPRNKDTDGDGYNDKQEIDSGFDPLTSPKK